MKTFISFSEFEQFCFELGNIIPRGKYKNIYGVPKNGLFIAIRLSDILNIPIIYDPANIDKDTLIVDDLVDSGHTLKGFSKNDCAVIFCKNNNKVSYYLYPSDAWIVFPWETEDDIDAHYTRILEYEGVSINSENLNKIKIYVRDL